VTAYGERFVRSIEVEALSQMMLMGAWSFRSVLQHYLVHDPHERNHQGLGDRLMLPEVGLVSHGGGVARRNRLGEVVTSNDRQVA
jgi:hypothetical protein